jgi:hypothetical protein
VTPPYLSVTPPSQSVTPKLPPPAVTPPYLSVTPPSQSVTPRLPTPVVTPPNLSVTLPSQSATPKLPPPAVTPPSQIATPLTPLPAAVAKPATPVMRSVAAASETPLAPAGMMAAEGANAFGTPVPPPQGAVGQHQLQQPPQQMGMAAQPYYPTARPPSMYQPPMDQGSATGMANAFTPAGVSRPIPANFGPQAQVPNAFGDGNTATVTYPAPMTNPNAMYPRPASGMDRGPIPMRPNYGSGPAQGAESSPHLMGVLRDALSPSQREAAAETLGGRNWHVEPQIADALIKAAKEDPWAPVRAECVRSLARMKVNTVPAVTVCQALKTDGDPRVRKEAEQALAVLLGGHSNANNPIRQASMTVP